MKAPCHQVLKYQELPMEKKGKQQQGMEAEATYTKEHGQRKHCAFWKLS